MGILNFIKRKKVKSDGEAIAERKAEVKRKADYAIWRENCNTITSILNAHMDVLEETFRSTHPPMFDVGNKVIVNKFSVKKPNSSSWEGGAIGLLGCMSGFVPKDKVIYAEITSVRVHRGFISEHIDKFIDAKDPKLGSLLKNKLFLISEFEDWIKNASKVSQLPMENGFYWEFGFTTNTDFNPSWGLSHNAFHFTGSEEGKTTKKIWEKEIKAKELVDVAEKLKCQNNSDLRSWELK